MIRTYSLPIATPLTLRSSFCPRLPPLLQIPRYLSNSGGATASYNAKKHSSKQPGNKRPVPKDASADERYQKKAFIKPEK